MWVDFDVIGQQGMDLFSGGSIIIDYGHVFWPEVYVKIYSKTVKNILMNDLFLINTVFHLRH